MHKVNGDLEKEATKLKQDAGMQDGAHSSRAGGQEGVQVGALEQKG